MLSADHRLRDSDAFRRTVRSGRRAGGAALVVHLLVPDPAAGHEQAPARVGFVVSKAVGNAVVRNRVKRRLRHLMREIVSTLPPAAEVVVRALPPAAGRSSEELGAELTRCLDRARSRPAPARVQATPARTGAAS